MVRCDDGDVSTARRLGLLRVEAVPELGRDRVLDRQRVDVARRQREDRGEDAADDLEEAPLRVGVDLVRRHRERHHGEDDAPPVRGEGNARAAAEAEAAAERRSIIMQTSCQDLARAKVSASQCLALILSGSKRMRRLSVTASEKTRFCMLVPGKTEKYPIHIYQMPGVYVKIH